ncbi:hypothetical protein Lesp02_02950 [Lentzea sp. NBRC 105346]|nr:hypothetical protein Lesp02_02950 [Lentzea sp. NBRC 105346]
MHLEASALRAYDLSWTAFVVMVILQSAGEAQTSHVAAQAGISKSTLTGVVKTLVHRGLLRREPHPIDRRLVLVELTAAGGEMLHEVSSKYSAEAEFVTSTLSPSETAVLTGLLARVTEHLNEAGEKRRALLHQDMTLPRRRSGRRAKQDA